MDIEKMLQAMHDTYDTEEKESMRQEIAKAIAGLSAEEKEQAKTVFLRCLDHQLEEAKEIIDSVDIFIELSEISKYISLSQIAKDYFGKSKHWLYQRIKGYNVNGKPARFTDAERKILAEALKDIGARLNQTSLKIA